jgi:hypothetical protein
MGDVFLAEDESLGRKVAIKIMSPRLGEDTMSRARFTREARAKALLEHPHIARVYSIGSLAGSSYIVMEYVEGEVLADRIAREGKLPLDDALRICRQIISALDASWSHKIVHRDIKPSNILLDKKGHVRVVDFGLAKPIEFAPADVAVTEAGHLLGTPHYLSPEQAQGQELDFRSDLYGVGITLFEMLTGTRPFDAVTPYEVVRQHMQDPLPSVRARRPDLSPAVDRFIHWLTEKRVEDRPHSYAEVLTAIDTMRRPIGAQTELMPVRIGPREPLIPKHIVEWLLAAVPLFVAFSVVAMLIVDRFDGLPASGTLIRAFAAVLVASVALGWWVARKWVDARKRSTRITLAATVGVAFLLAIVVAAFPEVVFVRTASDNGLLFTYGGYPSNAKLQQLKQAGYTAVVSLLDPNAVSFERIASSRLSSRVAAAGLDLISIPIDPWGAPTEAALDRIAELGSKQSGRYYVHGYLGSRRPDVVHTVVAETSRSNARKAPFTDFERGKLVDLSNGVFLGPCPTEQELGRFVIEGDVRQVVSLLDVKAPENRTIDEREQRTLSRLNVPFRSAGVSLADFDPSLVLQAAQSVRKGPKPVLVHSFFTPSSRRDPLALAFQIAYLTGRPPITQALFDEPMSTGTPEIIAPHIATGPQPAPSEFGAYLYRRGIRQFLFVGDPSSEEAKRDRAMAAENSLPWRAVEPKRDDVPSIVSSGGPYYLYGPAMPEVLSSVRARFEREMTFIGAARRP